MPEYLTPGVYVEEVSSGARPIQAVGTRTAGFVGVAPNARRYVNKAVAVNNWAEFVRRFATGDPPLVVIQNAVDDEARLQARIQSTKDTLDELTLKTLRERAEKSKKAAEQALSKAASQIFPATNLSMAVYGFFLNGGSRCYVVNVGSDDSAPTADELVQTAKGLVATANGLATTADALKERIDVPEKSATLMAEIAAELAERTQDLKAAADELTTTVDELANNPGVSAKIAEDLKTNAGKSARDAHDLVRRVDQLATSTGETNRSTTKLTTTATQLAETAEELSKTAGVPSETIKELETTAEKLEATAKDLGKTAGAPATTADALKTTADALKTTAEELEKTADALKTTAEELAKTPSVSTTTASARTKSKPRPISSRGSGQPPVGLDVLAQIDEVAIVAAPGYTDKDSYNDINTHCSSLKDRVGILDGPEIMREDVVQQLSGEELVDAPTKSDKWTKPDKADRGHVTLYVPWIEVSYPDAGRTLLNGNNGKVPERIIVPPSGHIAGVWARSDATRGVHKAPANEIVRGALGLAKQVTHEEQGMLNYHGVNVIRFFPNEGFLVWGARTLSKDPAFRYLNVRRLFNMIEESIAESTRWIVFEPNDRPLWKAIRRDVTSFLMGFWRDGALMGRTPQEAFYVKCDEETNPIESIREGKVIIEVGLAPVLPAEFVIFRISQYEAGTEVEIQS